MAKISYLNLVNRILRRINAGEISAVDGMSGKAKLIGNMLNEGQLVIMQEADWYDLYATDTFVTADGTDEYPAPADLNKMIGLTDVTNNRPLIEATVRGMDAADPNADSNSLPTHFAMQGTNYRLFPIPNGAYTIRERYWKIPAVMSADEATSDLNEELEVALITWAWAEMSFYMNSFEKAAALMNVYNNKLIPQAMKSNRKRIDKLDIFGPPDVSRYGIQPALLGGRYPRGY